MYYMYKYITGVQYSTPLSPSRNAKYIYIYILHLVFNIYINIYNI